ncbi:DegV domain-containing protein [Kitasatospora herbaricolor]|uniref:DegV family protein n=1 Tax=Kitasatospora herbaricolor TaxID=68217 RepID=UPI00174E5115|nr:DegV family protein [Kitasatospora herbaricolor]MDQ0308268.1 DegV family protein with EDD domain [Kitasatospora herbaricolor]GGV06396.1 DegV domain-containing protein [Kitasatospora herbaricolor]
MPADLAIVTDSTAYLPQDAVDRHGITVVPLSVAVGDEVLDEGVEISPKDVAEALRGKRRVTTSRPNPETFAAAYRAAAESGATGVVSLHLSAELSGTCEAARLAAAEAPIPVRVVDSRLVGMALGYCVLTAAQGAESGLTLDEVAASATRRAGLTSGFFYVDTLEHLRRGGRIGAARALLGSALAVKPLLHLSGGRIEPLEKVRTASRAIARLEEIAVDRAADREVDIAVHHLASADRAEPLAERLRERVPGLRELYVGEVGAVIGAHVGPGLLAVVLSPR